MTGELRSQTTDTEATQTFSLEGSYDHWKGLGSKGEPRLPSQPVLTGSGCPGKQHLCRRHHPTQKETGRDTPAFPGSHPPISCWHHHPPPTGWTSPATRRSGTQEAEIPQIQSQSVSARRGSEKKQRNGQHGTWGGSSHIRKCLELIFTHQKWKKKLLK